MKPVRCSATMKITEYFVYTWKALSSYFTAKTAAHIQQKRTKKGSRCVNPKIGVQVSKQRALNATNWHFEHNGTRNTFDYFETLTKYA